MDDFRILLVDDDLDDQAIIADAIKKIHVEASITCAANGEEALEVLNGLSLENAPCLIVLDLNMPKMSGAQTLEHLKADRRFYQIPVVIYSTSINPLEKEKCMMLGAHSYITKPVSYKESLETAQLFLNICKTRSKVLRNVI